MSRINKTVLMSDAHHFSTEQPINPYYHEVPVDYDKANSEHNHIKRMLIDVDIDVISVEAPLDSQDGVYTANWALVRGDKAVLASLPEARKAEEDYAEQILTSLGVTVTRVKEGLKFSGQGDALACGNLLFCGSGYRSDIEAQAFAADLLGYERIQLHTLPQRDADGQPVINASSGWADSFFYDIDLALSVIKAPTDTTPGLIAYCPEAFDKTSNQILQNLRGIETIKTTLQEATEAFASNLVSTGETVIMSAQAPLLRAALEAHGLKVVSPEITELSKGGGYIRCTTLTLD